VPTLISRPLHSESLGHCRDKIEFNLKSLKLEEHNRLLDRRLALRREEQLSDSILKVNKFLDLFSIHSLPAFSRRRLLQAPLFGGACKLLIRFCRSTRISNYLRFSRRLLSAFCRFLHAPFGGGTRKLAKQFGATRGFCKKFAVPL